MAWQNNQQNIMGYDGGNADLKGVSGINRACIVRHAMLEVPQSTIDAYQMRGELDAQDDLYRVNGIWIQIGDGAAKAGAQPLFGEQRYVANYYGRSAAIMAWGLFKDTQIDTWLVATHTPKDVIYTDDIREAVAGTWKVKHKGVEKRIRFTRVFTMDEPVAAFRSATISDQLTFQSQWLSDGTTMVLDTGGLTTAIAILENGKVRHDESDSFKMGMIELESQLAKAIKNRYRKELKGLNWLDPEAVRFALVNPVKGYDAKGLGFLTCEPEAKAILSPFMQGVGNLYRQYGGAAAANKLLLVGGGSLTLDNLYSKVLGHPHIYTVSKDKGVAYRLAAARGAFLTITMLHNKGKI